MTQTNLSKPQTPKSKIIIVGGGIAGLAAAYRLRQLLSEVDITLIEAAANLGGKIATERVEGFVLEGGPDCFLARKPRGVGLCEELGITAALQGRKPAPQTAYVLRHGRLHPLPAGLSGMIPTNLEALMGHSLLSAEGAVRVAQELDLPAAEGEADESVGAFVSRRFGREAFENLIEPLMGGIYAGRADELSLAATFPQLRQLERKYGSLLRGLNVPDRPSPAASDYPPFVAFANGMGQLVDEIVARLEGVEILCNTRVEGVQQGAGGRWQVVANGRALTADSLILTTPAYVTAALLADAAPDVAAPHAKIPYASTALVNLAFDAADLPELPEGYGYVVPLAEGREVLACTWTSQKWDCRAPEGKALLRLYIGRYGSADVTAYSDAQLAAMARGEVREVLGIEARPLFGRIHRWPRALPQYTLGHPERLAQIERALANHAGLFLAGAAYRGVGIPDCIASGEEAARANLQWLVTLYFSGYTV